MFKVNNKKFFWTKIFIVFGIICLSLLGIVYKFREQNNTLVKDFEYSRDAKEILNIFDKDWYWLVAASRENYDPEFTFRNKSHDKNPENFGKLVIKVLREKDRLAGFTAYFKQSFFEGYLLYVAVDRDFRGKGYGEILTNYAVKDMYALGCNVIHLVTRTENLKARSLYKKLGFSETAVDQVYAYYTKYKE